MYHFFVTKEQTSGERIEIIGDDVNHMKNVLRMKVGEQVTVSDGCDREYLCHIEEIFDDHIELKIEDIFGETRELPCEIVLFQGLPKGDKMELIIQKAVELGAARIVPVMTSRTIVKWDAKKAKKKIERYNTIAKTAAKQAKRSVIPVVEDVVNFSQACEMASELSANLIPYENAEGMEASRKAIADIKGRKSVGIFIGPEGGFEEKEVEQAMAIGATPITLGKRILRTETAGMAVLSILMFLLETED